MKIFILLLLAFPFCLTAQDLIPPPEHDDCDAEEIMPPPPLMGKPHDRENCPDSIRRGPPDFRMMQHDYLKSLKTKEPQTFVKLNALKTENPSQFRRELRKKMRTEFENTPEHRAFVQLVKKAKSGDSEAKAELRATISEQLERRIIETENHLKAETERLKDQEKRLEQLKNEREKNIDELLNRVLEKKKGKGKVNPQSRRNTP